MCLPTRCHSQGNKTTTSFGFASSARSCIFIRIFLELSTWFLGLAWKTGIHKYYLHYFQFWKIKICWTDSDRHVPIRGKELRKVLVSLEESPLSLSFLKFWSWRVLLLINRFLIKNVLNFKRHFPAVLLFSNGPGVCAGWWSRLYS